MIFDFLKKQKTSENKKKLSEVMIMNLNISNEQKALYLQALDILDEAGIERIYSTLSEFVKNLELKHIDELQEKNYAKISGLRKKEAEERKQELNSFNLLLNKL